jgi:hypothetical protein
MPISFDAMTDLVPEPFANVEAEIVEDTLSALSMSAPTAGFEPATFKLEGYRQKKTSGGGGGKFAECSPVCSPASSSHNNSRPSVPASA